MGIFGKVFEKKTCDFCGGEIGLLGNKKLEDGNMCKNCAEKLSPWFTGRKKSTVEEIRQQLEYREANKAAVAAFQTTRTMGGDRYTIYLDDQAGKFMVSNAKDLFTANPDVFDLSQIVSCKLDIQDSRTELKQEGADGKSVSYNPPRYVNRYRFYIDMVMKHPYAEKIRFPLNDHEIEVYSQGSRGFLTNQNPGAHDVVYQNYQNTGNQIVYTMTQRNGPMGQTVGFQGTQQPYGAAPGYTGVPNNQGYPAGVQQGYGVPAGVPGAYPAAGQQPYGAAPGYNGAVQNPGAAGYVVPPYAGGVGYQGGVPQGYSDAAPQGTGGYVQQGGYDPTAAVQPTMAQPTMANQGAVPNRNGGFCPNCGAPVAGGKFCEACGTKLI